MGRSCVALLAMAILAACDDGGRSTPNQPPSFTSSAAVSTSENSLATGYTAAATDRQPVEFAIDGGADAALFNLDAIGVLTFAATPDFEAPQDAGSDNIYEVVIVAKDSLGRSATQTVMITVLNLNEAPSITSNPTISVPEFALADLLILTAEDPDGDSVDFTITAGADAELFSLTDGSVSFLATADFESPQDSDGDNVYELTVSVSDPDGASAEQSLRVSVANVNEAPTFGNAPVIEALEESVALLTVVSATDPEQDALTYQVTGGEDAALFNLAANGDLTFLAAPDFEAPGDSDQNNVYQLQVQATDPAGAAATLDLSVNVLNVPFAIQNLTASPGAQPRTIRFSWQIVDEPPEVEYYRLLTRSDPQDTFDTSVSGQITASPYDLELNLTEVDFLNDEYLLEARDDNGDTVQSSNILPLLNNLASADIVGFFKASNAQSSDRFGHAVSISDDGDVLAISAPGEAGDGSSESDNSVSNAGAVYVFTRDEGIWTQSHYVKPSNPGADDFGTAIALTADGSQLIVTSPFESSASTTIDQGQADDSLDWTGAVYVFQLLQSSYTQEAYLKKSNLNDSEVFGDSVAVSGDGNFIAVGASENDSGIGGVNGSPTDTGALGSGAVYVFNRTNGSWGQQAFIKAAEPGANDRFGKSVALNNSGSLLAVGAHMEDSDANGINGSELDDSAASAGAVYVFERNLSNWGQTTFIKSPDSASGDQFGYSVELSDVGDRLVVGAPLARAVDSDSGATVNIGRAFVYDKVFPSWQYQAELIPLQRNAQDRWGIDVAISASAQHILVAGTHEDGSEAGLLADTGDNSVTDSGAVAVFALDQGSWWQTHHLKAAYVEATDYFGTSVALSEYGEVIVVGSPNEDSASMGINGDTRDNNAINAGAAYLY